MANKVSKEQFRDLVMKLAFRRGDFTLSSGEKSSYYIDIKNLSLHPSGAMAIGELAAQVVSLENYSGVGGPTLGADPLATSISLAAYHKNIILPAFIIRKEPKGYGRKKWIEGEENLRKPGPLLLLEDVVTTGSSAIKAIQIVRGEGYVVDTVLSVLDRSQLNDTVNEAGKYSERHSTAQKRFAEHGVRLVSLLHINDLRECYPAEFL